MYTKSRKIGIGGVSIETLEPRQMFSVAYGVTALPGLGGQTAPEAMNSAGTVVGYTVDSKGVNHAAMWKNGKLSLVGHFAAGVNSIANAIDNNGVIVGSVWTTKYQWLFRYSHGVTQILGAPKGFAVCTPSGINSLGQIVGTATTLENTPSFAFEYTGGKFVILHLPVVKGGTIGDSASGINDAGTIVGSISDSTGLENSSPFIDSDGKTKVLKPPYSTNSLVLAINNKGEIIGLSQSVPTTGSTGATTITPPPITDTFFLYAAGKYTVIGTGSNAATAINDAGVVVGVRGSHAWIVAGPKSSVDLNKEIRSSLGIDLQTPIAINSAGQIAVIGAHNGIAGAYLLTPLPPATKS